MHQLAALNEAVIQEKFCWLLRSEYLSTADRNSNLSLQDLSLYPTVLNIW